MMKLTKFILTLVFLSLCGIANAYDYCMDATLEGGFDMNTGSINLTVTAPTDFAKLDFDTFEYVAVAPVPDDTQITVVLTVQDEDRWGANLATYTETFLPGESKTFTFGSKDEWFTKETYYFSAKASFPDPDYEGWNIESVNEHNSLTISASVKPAKVSGYSAVSTKGGAPVVITFTTPTLIAESDSELPCDLTEASIYRTIGSKKFNKDTFEQYKLHTIENPEKGMVYSYRDETVEASKDETICYYIITSCPFGDSESVRVDVRLFPNDQPNSVGDITIEPQDDNKYKLTWTLSEEGRDGGYCDPDGVTFDVYRAYDWATSWLSSDPEKGGDAKKVVLDKCIQVASDLTDYSFTDDTSDENSIRSMRWIIVAKNDFGANKGESAKVVVGPDAEILPYEEKFNMIDDDKNNFSFHVWTIENSEEKWGLTGEASYNDGDYNTYYIKALESEENTYDAMMALEPSYFFEGDLDAGLSTQPINVANLEGNAVLSFYLYNMEAATKQTLKVTVEDPNDDSKVTEIGSIDLSSGAEGWNMYEYTIPESASGLWKVTFHAVVNDADWGDETLRPFMLDNISINGKYAEDPTTYVTNFEVSEIYRVYNASGICVMTTSNKSELYKLPHGLYIVNGKKVILNNP